MARIIRYDSKSKTWAVFSTNSMKDIAGGFKTIKELVNWLKRDFNEYRRDMNKRGYRVTLKLDKLVPMWIEEAMKAKMAAQLMDRSSEDDE